MFKTIKSKIIFVVIFCTICIAVTTGAIIYKNIEISKRIINTLLNINDTNLIHCQGIRSAQVRNRLSGVTKDDFDNALRFLASFNYLSIIDSGISSPLLVLHPQFYTRNNPLTHNSM